MGELKTILNPDDQAQYQKILDFMKEAGKRLVKVSGKIADIGVTKQFLTAEDLRIERGLGEIIKSFGDDHVLFAEEENDVIKEADDFWVVDPISGTESFIKGEGRYTIAVSHIHRGVGQFAAVYYPTADKFYTAYLGQGARLNGRLIKVKKSDTSKPQVILRVSKTWKDQDVVDKLRDLLVKYELVSYGGSDSMAISYCDVAEGFNNGIISFNKDCFPQFACGLIIREAGGEFTNLAGSSNLKPTDRVFIGGAKEIHPQLFSLVKEALDK
jgi:myo-inositol-1(or 4)-monophosphatase